MSAFITLPRLLTTEQAAAYLSIPEKTLRSWRCRGKGPPFFRLNPPDPRTGVIAKGQVVRYSVEKLDAWVESLTEGSLPAAALTSPPEAAAPQPARKRRPPVAVGAAV